MMALNGSVKNLSVFISYLKAESFSQQKLLFGNLWLKQSLDILDEVCCYSQPSLTKSYLDGCIA
jgi:hypothetical protein